MLGFGRKPQKYRLAKLWFSFYSKDNEDDPFEIERSEIRFLAGQDPVKPAIRLAERLIQSDPRIYEILIHRGPESVPTSGDDVMARVCREPFRDSKKLLPVADNA